MGREGSPDSRPSAKVSAQNEVTARRLLLAEYLADHAPSLQTTIHFYLSRVNVGSGEAIASAALEVFQEASATALTAASRFDPERSPGPWILGIAVNVIKRWKDEEMRRRRHEFHMPLFGDDADVTERLLPMSMRTQFPASAEMDDAATIEDLLSLVGPDDREVLTLALLHDCDSATLARLLGTNVGAARMRLHRAIARLRIAWIGSEQSINGTGNEQRRRP